MHQTAMSTTSNYMCLNLREKIFSVAETEEKKHCGLDLATSNLDSISKRFFDAHDRQDLFVFCLWNDVNNYVTEKKSC